jgi:hypothetical protein
LAVALLTLTSVACAESRTAISSSNGELKCSSDNDPHPTTELHFSSPFELLIAVLLSAQATDVSVNIARRLALFMLRFPCRVRRGDSVGPGRLRLPLLAT